MKQLLFLFLSMLFFISCVDNKKKEQELVEKAIKKIDSIEVNINQGIESLEETTNEVEEQLKELDSI
ncbi:hypothetical protein [Flavisericum labens]|uniref:hypothetical protein n=1 Tax=Flavisericum labens TaxID=3377112 RepID=UPI00387AA536